MLAPCIHSLIYSCWKQKLGALEGGTAGSPFQSPDHTVLQIDHRGLAGDVCIGSNQSIPTQSRPYVLATGVHRDAEEGIGWNLALLATLRTVLASS